MSHRIPLRKFRHAVFGLVLFGGVALLILVYGGLNLAAANSSASFFYEPRGLNVLMIGHSTSGNFQVDANAGRSVVGKSSSSNFSISDNYPAEFENHLYLPLLCKTP